MTARERNEGRAVPLESVERLVRSLVGVVDVCVTAGAGGRIERLVVTPEAGAPERQVVLNVTSGLLAGLGVSIDPGVLTLVAPEPPEVTGDDLASASSPPVSPAPAATAISPVPESGARAADEPVVVPVRLSPKAQQVEAAAPAQVQLATADHSAVSLASAEAARAYRRVAGRIVPAAAPGVPARAVRHEARTAAALAALHDQLPGAGSQPLLEQVELWPVEDRIRCRVTLAVGPDRFFGLADALDLPGASLELPARVTLDALRAARVPDAPSQLDGVTIADIRGRHFVLAAVQLWTGEDFTPLAGAVAVHASYEEAAARAVLQALNSRNC